ncbi:MAG: DUF1501 domain-containing protein [Planctomycetes bacterium]|nr:DUF1501 domain-containing protein [Planctomycetota bacterium]
MLSIQGRGTKLCDGITRRELMRVGGLSLFGGMTLPRLLEAAGDRGGPSGRVKSVVLFNMLGGPSHQDMFDMKPLAPKEIRGEFQPIATSVPSLQICEHMPNTAKLMHKACLIRSVTHGYNSHNPLNIMTGFLAGDPKQLRPERSDPPDIGAICQYLEMGPRDMPGAFCLPCYPGWGERSQYPGIRRPGPYGGFLGSQYDPLISVCNPTFDHVPERKYYDPVWPMGAPVLPLDEPPPEMTLDRLNERRTLLEQFDDQSRELDAADAVGRMNRVKQQAFSMIRSSRTRDAFDLSHESDETRDRYGRNLHGSSMLVARRLVEARVPFISVHAENFIPHGFTYDMHENNFGMLKDYNLPVFDKLYPAFVEDLEARGLLDSTLIVVMGEMGRSPKVNAKAGRDHWPQCGFCLLTGGGTSPGAVFGATDKHAAYPTSDAVSPSDIVATIYHLLGIDPHMTVDDPAGRPIPIAHGGEVIREVLV